MADLGVDELFIINMIDLLSLDDLALIKKFEGDILAGLFVFGHFDLTKTSLAENSSHFVVLQFEFSDSLSFTFLHGIFLNIDYNVNRKRDLS